MQELEQTLLRKLQDESFPSFCQILPPLDSPQAGKDFLSRCLLAYFTKPGKVLEHHADVYYPPRPTGVSGYKIEELRDFFSFTQSRPFSEKLKIAIFEYPEQLSQNILNKWLKTLEEPPSYLKIFFINTTHKKLLATIESRSIKIRLPLSPSDQHDPVQSESLIPLIQAGKVQALADKLKILREEERWSRFSEAMKEYENQWNYTFSSKGLEALKNLQRSQTFHNQPMQRYLPFIGQIKDISSGEFGQSE